MIYVPEGVAQRFFWKLCGFLTVVEYFGLVAGLCGRTGSGMIIHGVCEGRDEEREKGRRAQPGFGPLK